MTKEPEALRIADAIDNNYAQWEVDFASVELRRLHDVNTDLLDALKKAEELCTSVFESNWRNWEELASPDEFERWAKRRCAHAAIYLKEAIANARLIAAAPDLLDALAVLTELVSFQICGDGHPAIINARAAIAKATGGAS